MPHIDPFAPADDPRHPSQMGNVTEGVVRQSRADVAAYDELAGTHLTPAEHELREGARESGPVLPSMEELHARVDALTDYLARRDSDDGEPPRITDVFGVEHVLQASEDGSTARWVPVTRTYADMTNNELKALLSDRDLPVSGAKPELIARLEEADKAGAEAAE